MRSTAHFKGHPLHPMLVPFPIAFFGGALLFDLLGILLDRESWIATGYHLAAAGVIAALITALPGIVDYFRAVPPESSGKRRATKHGLVNVGATVLFAVAWLMRDGAAAEPGVAILALEAAGVVLLVAGGWMGGTLVYRNQIAVDHRYAFAGKWNEERIDAASGPIVVARSGELERDQMKLVVIGDRRIVVGRTEEGHVAFDDRCTHRGGSLADGVLMCGKVHCPWHGSQFDVRGGGVEAGPAKEGIRTYAVTETAGEVRITL